MTTPEAGVKKDIRAMLAAFGITKKTAEVGYYWEPVPFGMGTNGISDFLCLIHGRFLAIEAKEHERKEPTSLQKRFHKNVLAAGGLTFVAHGNNLDVLRSLLQRLTS